MEDNKQDEKISEDNDCDLGLIYNLSDDCLIEIFSLLPIADKMRIQRVCKRWRDLSRTSWSWRRHKTLCVDACNWGRDSSLPDERFDLSILQNILKLCGPFVTRVDFGEIYPDIYVFEVNEDLFRVIGEQCPNVTSVNVECVDTDTECLEYLAKTQSNLTEFRISQYDDWSKDLDYNRPMAALFHRNKNLRRLELHINLNANCFLNLNPEAIQELEIEGVYEPTDSLCTALKNFINLETFIIDDSWSYVDLTIPINEFLKAIAFHGKSLKQLNISECSTSIDSSIVSCFTNLEKLSLGRQVLSDNFLEVVCKNCTNLKHIELLGVKNATGVDMKNIASLPKLQILCLYNMKNTLDDIFNTGMLSLKELNCAICPELGTSAICEFLRTSKNVIERLEIRSCDNVCASDLINVAKEVTVGRVCTPALKLIIDKSAENARFVTETSQFFELIER